MVAGSMLFWLFLFKHQEKELLATSVKYGYSFVDYIRNSTRYGMLTVQETLIQQTVEAVGIAEGILNVRIFNSRGAVAYSSDKKHIGTILDKNSPLCLRCHTASGPTKDTPSWTIAKGEHYRVLNIVQPIYNFKVTINRRDEIGELANTFNAISDELRKVKNKRMEWSNTLEKKVQEKTEAIRRTQQQLIHSEKLASLGRKAAGVAHEINSPLTGIVTFGHLLLKKFPQGTEDREDVEVIIDQANRCSTIIKGLPGFARATTADKAQTNINDVLNSTLNIVKNKADFFNIKLSANLDPSLSMVKADAPQLQQVYLKGTSFFIWLPALKETA